MPATVSYCQSIGTPECYQHKDGRYVEVRWGTVYDGSTRKELAKPSEAGDYILKHCRLQEWERELIVNWKRDAWKSTGSTRSAINMAASDKRYRQFEKRGDA